MVVAAAPSVGWSTLLSMGLVDAVVLAGCIGLGLLIDSAAGTAPLFLLIGLLVGIAVAVGYTVSRFRTYLHVR